MNNLYKEQVRLLLRILPIIYREEDFAVHGGTAINLFIKDLPRYSVDVDVTYIPLGPRDECLADIDNKLVSISQQLQAKDSPWICSACSVDPASRRKPGCGMTSCMVVMRGEAAARRQTFTKKVKCASRSGLTPYYPQGACHPSPVDIG